MPLDQRIARILGPVLIVLSLTEALNLDRFAGNPAPVVYLNGTLLLVAGVAILQAHNRWSLDWRVLLTLSGWALAAAGLFRMVMPGAVQLGGGPSADAAFVILVLVGAILSWKGYHRSRPG